MSYMEIEYSKGKSDDLEICVFNNTEENEDNFSHKDWILRISDIISKKGTNHGILSYLLKHKVITKEDGDHFKNAVRFVYDSEYYHVLFDYNIVNKQDNEELFSEIVNKILNNKDRCTYLIKSGHFTKKNNYNIFINLYKTLMNKEKKNTNYDVKNHIGNYHINKDDKELFELTIISAISNEMNAFNILKDNIITSKDGDLFTQTVNAIKKPQLRENLIKCGIIEE